MNIFIGIDPGKTGGITFLELLSPHTSLSIFRMPGTEKEIRDIFGDIHGWEGLSLSEGIGVKAIIEAQHAFPDMGAKAQWSFAQHYGFIRGCLVSLGVPFIEVSPQKWMAYFGFKRLKDEDKKKHKLKILQKAQNLYPQSTVNLQTADSLMLCEYLRLTDRS